MFSHQGRHYQRLGAAAGRISLGFDHRHTNLQEVRTIARDIVSLAVDNMPLRKAANVFIPQVSAEAEIGFSIENLAEAFGGHPVLAEMLKDGAIQGIVNLVGCNNPKVPYEPASRRSPTFC